MPKKSLAPEVLPPESQDLTVTRTDGGSIQSFLANLTSFFREAASLEARSAKTLELAKTWTAPTDGTTDQVLVERVRAIATERREIEAHWEITALVSRFHRRLTAARDRALKPLEEATRIGTLLHNRYADEERHRARMEEDRLRREAEERARQEREIELARLEAEAVKAEAANPDLTEREERFVDLYCAGGWTPYEAAKMAGYRNADKQTPKLLELPKIREAITSKQGAIRLRQQAEATRSAPVLTTHAPVKADIATAGVTRYSADCVDPDSLLAAVLDPMTRTRLGIPVDVLTVNEPKLNEYARSLREQIERWPGVRVVKTTSIR